MPDLELGALGGGVERIRNRAQRRVPFLVRHAGDEQVAVDELHVGDRRRPRILTGRRIVGGRVHQGDRGVRDVVERQRRHLTRRLDLDDQRLGVGATTACRRHVHVLRNRVHRDVVDQNLIRHHADQPGDGRVQTLDIEGRRRRGRLVVGVEGDDRAADRIADEQHAVGTERERACRLEVGLAGRQHGAGLHRSIHAENQERDHESRAERERGTDEKARLHSPSAKENRPGDGNGQ